MAIASDAPDRQNRSGGRRRGSSRARNRRGAERGANAHLVCPYIVRGLPPYDILSDEGLARIEAAADRILAEIGIEIREDSHAVELFRAAGGAVTPTGPDAARIRFEPGLIRALCATAPECFTQLARNPVRSVRIGGESTVFAPSYGSPFIMEPDGSRRYATLRDFERLVMLGQSSPWLHHSGGTVCEPTDVAVNKRHLDMVLAHMRYSDRAFLGSITHPDRAADTIEMCRILFGAEVVDKNCVVIGNFNTTSPLVLDGITTRGIRTYAAAGQGTIILPFLLGGAVTPVTTAGALAQCLAESLTGVALTQLVRPGAPAILAAFLATLDLRSGSPTFGTPESAVGSLAMGQLARRARLPLRCAGNFTNSKIADAQSATQSMMSMLSAVQCGANYVLHSAGFVDGLLSMSFEKFVMDLDVCAAMHAYLKGIDLGDDAFGIDALAEHGPGAHLFGTQHTLRHYQTAYWDSALDDYQPWETWDETGRQDARTRAGKVVAATLEAYERPPLDAGTEAALDDYVARKKSESKDLWH